MSSAQHVWHNYDTLYNYHSCYTAHQYKGYNLFLSDIPFCILTSTARTTFRRKIPKLHTQVGKRLEGTESSS